LIIDDNRSILTTFGEVFRENGFSVLTAPSAAEGLGYLAQQRPDVVLLDVSLPDQSGFETFQHIQVCDTRIPVIFITGEGTTETAIEAMKLGAYDYLVKPIELGKLEELVRRAASMSRLMRVSTAADEDVVPEPSYALVGRSPAMQEVYKAVGRVALKDITVLILGESGTGKELVARAIHHHSRRSTGPFLAMNCSAIPETLLESELFGHEKGAFTGADRRRIGKFEQCTGGTLFLDEIGDMAPLTQTKMLRLLQEQRFERVGGSETIQTNVRLIAATNCNLEQLVAKGAFRQDLYYRLSSFTISLPALRERTDDLPLLVDYFLRRYNLELGREIRQVAPEAMACLQRYTWPGNVRELQNILRQALLHAAGPVLFPDFLPACVRGAQQTETPGTSTPLASLEDFFKERISAGSQNLYSESVALIERNLLTYVLLCTGGNQARAAKILGISRLSLRIKLRSLAITIERPGLIIKEPPR
jgi:two-component system nitrogen regulation response regulator GlnG